jgi:hypothetical protein
VLTEPSSEATMIALENSQEVLLDAPPSLLILVVSVVCVDVLSTKDELADVNEPPSNKRNSWLSDPAGCLIISAGLDKIPILREEIVEIGLVLSLEIRELYDLLNWSTRRGSDFSAKIWRTVSMNCHPCEHIVNSAIFSPDAAQWSNGEGYPSAVIRLEGH